MINLGLIGYPLDHSLSPKIHQTALESCGLEGKYCLYPIFSNDLQGLKNILNRVRSGEITGLNVTIPHKESVISLLDQLTPTAEAIGAVNTIFMLKGKLTGENTDSPGFLTDLYHQFDLGKGKRKENHNALVLGAGGSARAVTHALLEDGWNITLTARRPDQADELIAQFSSHGSRLSCLEYRPGTLLSLIKFLRLIVNATPVGMLPDVDFSPWPEGLPFPRKAMVYDLVYNPRETKLIRDARAVGLPAVTGLGMLVEQAALAFKLWTGYEVARKEMLGTQIFSEARTKSQCD